MEEIAATDGLMWGSWSVDGLQGGVSGNSKAAQLGSRDYPKARLSPRITIASFGERRNPTKRHAATSKQLHHLCAGEARPGNPKL